MSAEGIEMHKRAVLRTVVAAVVAVLAYAAYVGWLGLQARSELTSAVDAATDLRSALEDQDAPGAEKSLTVFRDHAAEAEDATGSPAWSLLTHVPFVGDDAAAVRVLSSVAVELADEGVAPLIDAGATDPERFAPKNGRIDLAQIQKLAGPLTRSATAFDAAEKQLATVDVDGLVGPLASRWREGTADISLAARGLRAGRVAADVLPAMLGADGPRKQLLVFQTNAEPRAPGGMPGSLALLEVDGGRFELGRQVAAAKLGDLPDPVLPITPEEEARFGSQLVTDARDAAFTPHFPRQAELLAAHWTGRYQDRLDGAVAIDPVALGYLLEATGPITVAGVELTSSNVARELLHGAYFRTQDLELQDLWFEAVAGAVFDRISKGPLDGTKLVRGLARGVEEGRIYVASFHPEEQASLAGTTVAGEVPSSVEEPVQAGVFLNDSTASKMGWFLEYDVEVTSSCKDGARVAIIATMDVGSNLKPGTPLPETVSPGDFGVAPGDHLVSVDLFGPQGGELGGLTFDGETQSSAEFSTYRGHPTTSVAVFLSPGAKHRITWTMKVPAAASDEPVAVRVSAGVHPGNESVTAPPC